MVFLSTLEQVSQWSLHSAHLLSDVTSRPLPRISDRQSDAPLGQRNVSHARSAICDSIGRVDRRCKPRRVIPNSPGSVEERIQSHTERVRPSARPQCRQRCIDDDLQTRAGEPRFVVYVALARLTRVISADVVFSLAVRLTYRHETGETSVHHIARNDPLLRR
jgi:hypothetical protein